MNLKSLLSGAVVVAASCLAQSAWAQEDVTAQYISNPSFEADAAATGDASLAITGWQIAFTGGISDVAIETNAATKSGFGQSNPSDGEKYFFNRKGWGNSVGTLSTTTTNPLPVGSYYVSFDYKAADYSNNNNAKNNGSTLSVKVEQEAATLIETAAKKVAYSLANNGSNPAGDQYFANIGWTKGGAMFSVKSEGVVTISLIYSMVNSGRSDFEFDNVRLYRLSKGETSVDVTGMIANPSFETGNTNAWTVKSISGGDIGAKSLSNATYAATNADGLYIFNTWSPDAEEKFIKQTITLPYGQYKLSAVVASDAEKNIKIYAGDKETQAVTTDKGTGVPVEVVFTAIGDVEIGASSPTDWFKVDNFQLTYLGAQVDLSLYNAALNKAKAVDAKAAMSKTVQKALLDAIADDATLDKEDADAVLDAIEKLNNAVDGANASIAAYATGKVALDAQKEFLDKTNFYTAAAYEAYGYVANSAKYEAGILTDEEVKVLDNPSAVTGWRAANAIDDVLMSVWDEEPIMWDSYHVNTWSNEGSIDGTNFVVPFIEYWSGTTPLATKTMTAQISGVKPNTFYSISAWIRIEKIDVANNNVNITMQVGNSTPMVLATDNVVGKFLLDTFTATGLSDNDGNLTLKFAVGEDCNAGWFAFRDVKYTEVTEGIVELSENDVVAPTAGSTKNVTLTRTYATGDNWSTICLPFAIEASELGEGAEVAELTGVEGATINFTTGITTLEAGKSYIVKGATATTINASGVNVLAAPVPVSKGGFTMTGTFNKTTISSGEFFINGNKGYVADQPVEVKGFRAYIKAEMPASAKVLNIAVDGEATGIATIENGELKINEGAIYNVAGQRINKPAKGLYIQNGKKILVK